MTTAKRKKDEIKPNLFMQPGSTYAERIAGLTGEDDTDKSFKTDNRDRAMTYRVGDDIIGRVNRVAQQHNVEKSPLVKFLLTYALDALERGELKLPLQEKKREIDFSNL